MALRVRTASPGRGWAWLAGGFVLFMRSPLQWLLLLIILYAGKKLLSAIPVMAVAWLLSLLAMLLMPVFLAGLMDGCRAVAAGERLQVGHLLQGFRHNAANLVTIGGVSLIGNLAVMMVMAAIGGDAVSSLMKLMASGEPVTPGTAGHVQAAWTSIAQALLVGLLLTLPLLMALWFSPLLVYFDDVKPLAALKLSLVACLKNTLPLLVYSLPPVAVMFVLAPVTMRLREIDLALWLMAPVLVPSIYVSYRDLFVSKEDAEPPADSPGPAN